MSLEMNTLDNAEGNDEAFAVPHELARLPRESALMYDAFLVYLRLGPRRSIRQVAAAHGHDERALERISSKFRWRARTRAYDDLIARRKLAAIIADATATDEGRAA